MATPLEQAETWALRALARADRSTAWLSAQLEARFGALTMTAVLTSLRAQALLDDTKAAHRRAELLLHRKPLARDGLVATLLGEGFTADAVQQAAHALATDNEGEQLRALVAAGLRKGSSPRALGRRLLRLGYAEESVRDALRAQGVDGEPNH